MDTGPAEKIARYDTNYQQCIICQTETDQDVMMAPTSHEKVLNMIRERAKDGDGHYPEISRRLAKVTHETLKLNSATWHRKCYQDTVHVGMCKRAKERYEKKLAGMQGTSSSQSASSGGIFTRSQSAPYNKELCFFCENSGSIRNPLHKVSTHSAGKNLEAAIQQSGNERLYVKLCTSIDTEDAHAIDIRYHKRCWATHVTNIYHKGKELPYSKQFSADELGAQIEFVSLVESTLLDGNVVSISALQEVYEDILSANNVVKPFCSRKKLKELLECEIPQVEFHKSKRVNEAERVTLKSTRDAAVQVMEENSDNSEVDMNALYNAASILRKSIRKAEKWTFEGSLTDVTSKHLPKELYCFFRWVLQGPRTTLSTDKKSSQVNKNALNLAQSTVSMYLSNYQISNKKSQSLRAMHEMPQQLAVGVAIRQATRSKKIINILHKFGMSVDYTRLLRIEGQIANTVLQRMRVNNGVYVPPDFVMGRHIFFAVDNVDFSEDTPDGKHTLHATAMAIYQRCHPEDEAPRLELPQPSLRGNKKDLFSSGTKLLICQKPASHPHSPIYSSFTLRKGVPQQPLNGCLPDVTWLVGRTLIRSQRAVKEPVEEDDIGLLPDQRKPSQENIPTWSAYHSLTNNDILPATRVGTPPLIAAPAHEWATLLTVLKQAQGISTKVMGPNHKTVISLDMGLYKPAKQMQMARKDLNHLVLRPGELHIVMAELRCIGAYIENSGLDFCWTEADLYGPTTVKQILEGKHMKRGVEAHVVTLQSLFQLYQTAFLKDHHDLQEPLTKAAQALERSFVDGSCEDIKRTQATLVQAIQSCMLMEKMSHFDTANGNKPLFFVLRQYMQMVMVMLVFIRSVRSGDWKLHLQALEDFCKHFFAMDKLVYARMIPLYLADMELLRESDKDIYEEFLQGNWVVNKNRQVPFCAIGADHALEHVNRSMKVPGGLIGITQNAYARSKFFLISPELAKLAGEACEIAGMSLPAQTHHHAHSPAVFIRQEKSIEALTATLENFTNPFAVESCELFNLVTKAVVPEKIRIDLCNESTIGSELFTEFVSNRINSSKVNLWAPMKKRQLHTWKMMGKQLKVNTGDKMVELKEDRKLFTRMLLVSKSRPNINLEETVGRHELSVVPRSMFAADGVMLRCHMKSSLMVILENLPKSGESEPYRDSESDQSHLGGGKPAGVTVALVDGMAEVQSLEKPDYITNCSQMAEHFTNRILQKYNNADEIHLVFDRYDISKSLKSATRDKRQGNQPVISYHITDTTNITKVPMKKLLSHVQTKMKLTGYLAEKMLEKARVENKPMVVAWGAQCQANHRDVSHLNSQQEEADTKLILHAIDATTCGASTINIYSPDTDVFILALRRYPMLSRDTNFVTGTGTKRRTIPLGPIYQTIGPDKAAALPGLHAFSGADNTGSFAGRGKLAFWKRFWEAKDDSNEISALKSLGTTRMPTDIVYVGLEEFLCKVYLPDTMIANVAKLRWWLFTKKQAESERLPPTQDALHQAVLRAHYQAIIWNNDTVPNPKLPSPQDYGWNLEDVWVPVMTKELPAPKSVLQLVKCGCVKTKCESNRCTCRKAGLSCTDICGCCDIGEACDNAEQLSVSCTINNEDEDGEDDLEDGEMF